MHNHKMFLIKLSKYFNVMMFLDFFFFISLLKLMLWVFERHINIGFGKGNLAKF